MTIRCLRNGIVGLILGSMPPALYILPVQALPSSIASDFSPENAISAQPPTRAVVLPRDGVKLEDLVEQQFVIEMVPYQQDAIALADLALTHAKHPQIRVLAQTIKQSQTQKHQQLQAWYQMQYQAEVPDSLAWHQAMGLAPAGVGGAEANDLSAIAIAPDFDRVFLEEMMLHYQMGILMSQRALADSDCAHIQTFANVIIQAQAAKIDEMQYWYQKWYVEGLR